MDEEEQQQQGTGHSSGNSRALRRDKSGTRTKKGHVLVRSGQEFTSGRARGDMTGSRASPGSSSSALRKKGGAAATGVAGSSAAATGRGQQPYAYLRLKPSMTREKYRQLSINTLAPLVKRVNKGAVAAKKIRAKNIRKRKR
eukprot:GHVU01142186.1.p1 GENE.GHVU01142186.1~~GHVU01142186.1.p1  ORF type:complete len:162 (+),score=36.01 GHVU01142186.1:62-487(+)